MYISNNISSKSIETPMAGRNGHNISAHNSELLISEPGQNLISCLMIKNCFGTNLFFGALHSYTAGSSRSAMVRGIFHTLEFERKACRVCFKNAFGQRLPSPGSLDINFGLLDRNPTLNSSQWIKNKKKRKRAIKTHTSSNSRMALSSIVDLCYKVNFTPNSISNSCAPSYVNNPSTLTIRTNKRGTKSAPGHKRSQYGVPMDKRLIQSGIQVLSSDWVLEGLMNQIQKKRSVRGVMYQCIRDIQTLLNNLRRSSPVSGARITASGRLGKQKKGMAKKLMLSIGTAPNGTFSQKIDYSQGFVVTKFGLVGLKVTVAFR